MTENQLNQMAIAKLGFDRFTHGLATAEWEPFLDLVAEDFTFWFPIGQFQGWNVGKEKARTFFNYVSTAFPEGLQVKLERIANNDKTVVFEFESKGLLWGKPYHNQVAVSFDVEGNQITAYREYLAIVVPPSAGNG